VTGRLHQVRLHLAAIGCPVLGEDFYADSSVREQASRYALHAHRVVFRHPVTGETVDVKSAWPDDLKGLLTRMGIGRPDLVKAEEAQ
jgi:23S rRNA pseudouridine1911/1915/1917 synthase